MYDKRIMGKVYLYNGILPQNGKWTTAIHQQWINRKNDDVMPDIKEYV